MHITAQSADPYALDAHITLDKGELAAYMSDVTDDLARQTTVEGFRKGKAPRELAEQQLDPVLVRRHVLERALEDSFTKAADQEKWDVMRTTDLKVIKNDSDALEYSVRVALWPAVALPDLAAVKVARKPVHASDAEVGEALDTVRNMRATFLDKTGPAAAGDRLEVDFDASIAGQPVPGGSSRNHPLVIGGKTFMPGFEEELIGLVTGQRKQFSLTAPADYYEATLAGKNIDFEVTVNRVQTVLKPAADDAFAKSLGHFQDLAQLQDSMRQGVIRDKQTKERQRVRLAILDAIIAAIQVPAPESMVREELDGMVSRFGDDLRSRGTELAMYLAHLKKTEDALRKDWQNEAERQVRIMLVIRAAAKARAVAVLPEELEQALTETVSELLKTGRVREDQIDTDRLRVALAQRILTDKTLDELETLCAIQE
jgi:trigger factor